MKFNLKKIMFKFKIKNNNSNNTIRMQLQKFFFAIAVVFLLVAFLASAYISIENVRVYNLRGQNSSSEILAELIKPALKISDYLEVQRLLGLVSNKSSVYSVITGQGDVLLQDYTQRFLINNLGTINNPQLCLNFSGHTKFINGKSWTIYCSIIENIKNNTKKIEKPDLLLSFIEVPTLQISFLDFFKLLILLMGTLIFSIIFIRIFIAKKLIGPIEELLQSIKHREVLVPKQNIPEIVFKNIAPKEIDDLRISFNQLINVIQKNYLDRQEIKSNHVRALMAQQVAHDIRSPLSALDMMQEYMLGLPEEVRLITRSSINRIRDIANALLENNKKQKINSELEFSTEAFSTILLSPLIDSIVTEKRMQYRNYLAVDIDFIANKDSYGLFSNIRPNEFKRALSNLITNSVEAFAHQKGKVEIILFINHKNFIELQIKDNGAGIPENILEMIGTRGFTHGKKNGSGLGLFHTKTTIQSFK